jgi:hypothetical protein
MTGHPKAFAVWSGRAWEGLYPDRSGAEASAASLREGLGVPARVYSECETCEFVHAVDVACVMVTHGDMPPPSPLNYHPETPGKERRVAECARMFARGQNQNLNG